MNISPLTVNVLQQAGWDAHRVSTPLSADASDESILAYAAETDQAVCTQDLDFSALLAVSGRAQPSLITLRLSNPGPTDRHGASSGRTPCGDEGRATGSRRHHRGPCDSRAVVAHTGVNTTLLSGHRPPRRAEKTRGSVPGAFIKRCTLDRPRKYESSV
ncbi:DUF5615 family PIN-like protein [Salinibacter ruber]|uniref:DUF5615 family PIN-like protein n=1 Tax=Salinibacter ruber TaxID=146919 RepID=UPI003C6E8481